jgi:hypothetical protein
MKIHHAAGFVLGTSGEAWAAAWEQQRWPDDRLVEDHEAKETPGR